MHEIHPNLICGTQPRNPQEIEQLAKQHRVNVILNLQQDKDMQYWGIDWQANQHKYHELGVQLIRKPVSTGAEGPRMQQPALRLPYRHASTPPQPYLPLE